MNEFEESGILHADAPEIIISQNLVSYMESQEFMEKRVAEIAAGTSPETIWFLEHPIVYTAGASAQDKDAPSSLSVIRASRGGKHTHHAPGQCVCYLMLNLKKRSGGGVPDPRKYVKTLENIIINALSTFGLKTEVRPDRIGVWAINGSEAFKEQKIAAIGVKFKKGVTLHGFAVNVNNDLSLFDKIVPCGISEFGVCSLESLGVLATMSQVIAALNAQIKQTFYHNTPLHLRFQKK